MDEFESLLRRAASGKPVPVEPDAAMRAMAQTLRAQYVAFKESGFTAAQAFELVRSMLVQIVSAGLNRSDGQ